MNHFAVATSPKYAFRASLTLNTQDFTARLHDRKCSPLYKLQFTVNMITTNSYADKLYVRGPPGTAVCKTDELKASLENCFVDSYNRSDDGVCVTCHSISNSKELHILGTLVPEQQPWVPPNNTTTYCPIPSPTVIKTSRGPRAMLSISTGREDGFGQGNLWDNLGYMKFVAKTVKVTFRGGVKPPYVCLRPVAKVESIQYLLKLFPTLEVYEYSVHGIHVAVDCRDKTTGTRCMVYGDLNAESDVLVRNGSVWTSHGVMV